jgi:diguanylate cyclase (GGDEF)-like protein
MLDGQPTGKYVGSTVVPEEVTTAQHFNISTMIVAGFSLILAAVIGLGWFATDNMDRLGNIAKDIFTHPLAVSNAASDLRTTLFQLRINMLQATLIRDGRDIGVIYDVDSALARQARADLKVIKNNFLGDMSKVDELEVKLDQWDVIRENVLAQVEMERFPSAEQLFKTVSTQQFGDMLPLIDYILDFAANKGKEYVVEAHQRSDQIISSGRQLILLLSGFIALIGFVVIGRVRYLHRQLNRQASTDYLTRVPNRRHFMSMIDRELARSHRYGTPFSLAIVDLDRFKDVNDKYGHQVGDRVLKRFSEVCQSALRDSDTVGRVGGEEFALLLPNTQLNEATEVVERARKAIESAEIPTMENSNIRFTASFGLTAYRSADDDTTSLFRRADDALYEAKSTGRNRVCANDSS